MAQAIPRESVLHVLQRRYDHQSAQVVFKRAVEVVKLRDQEHYTSEELQTISQGLQKVGDHLDALIGPLMALASMATPAAPKWETPKREVAREERKPARAPATAEATSAPAPAVAESPSPTTLTAPPTSTTTETQTARSTPEATATAEATAAAGSGHAEDASSSEHADSGEAEGEGTEPAAGEEPRETKGRSRRKR
jgi:hypothetical protein